jgi:hypothetical protein
MARWPWGVGSDLLACMDYLSWLFVVVKTATAPRAGENHYDDDDDSISRSNRNSSNNKEIEDLFFVVVVVVVTREKKYNMLCVF